MARQQTPTITLTIDTHLRQALDYLATGTDGTPEEIARKAILDAALQTRACDSRQAHTTRSSSMEPNIQAGQVWESIYGGAHVAITRIDGTRIRLATVTIEGDAAHPYGSERWATVGQLSKAYRLTGLVITEEEQ
ncbi:hypothetical protein ACJ6WD_09600 [Streptomyces sp. VTCC 41912]|uniref:hypothetical protein n=1 Tax=Streptomyces sp. VTCC 41912 TaxID=3383243 RepID=UPI003896B5F7